MESLTSKIQSLLLNQLQSQDGFLSPSSPQHPFSASDSTFTSSSSHSYSSSSSTSTINGTSTLSSESDPFVTSRHRSLFQKICKNGEGWGPESPIRDFDLSPCFQQATLRIAPAVIFLILGSLTIFFLYRKPLRSLTKLSNLLLRAKLILTSTLILSTSLLLSLQFSTLTSPLSNLSFYSTISILLAYLLSIPITRINHTRERRSNTLLIFFWLLTFLADLVELRTRLTWPSPEIKRDVAGFTIFVFNTVLVFTLFWLECWGIEVGKSESTSSDNDRATATSSSINGNANNNNNKTKSDKKINGESNGHVDQEARTPSSSQELDADDGEGVDAEVGENKEIGAGNECPVVTANIWSRIFFFWMQPLMTLGSKKFLTEEDMWALPPNEDAEALGKRFETNWKATRSEKTGKPKLWTSLAYSYGGPFLLAAVYKAIQDTLAFVQPQLLRMLLKFVQNWDEEPKSERRAIQGFALSASLFLVAVTQTAFLHQYFQLAFTTGMRVRAGLVSAIYKKSLRMGNEDRKEGTGQIVNYMSVDATRLQDLCTYGHIVWSALFQMTLAFVSLYVLLGWQAFVGVGIMVVSIPLNTMLARTLKKLSEKQMKVKDRRTRLMNEILSNIKSIKLFAWEEAFTSKLYQVRNNEELRLLRTVGAVSSLFQFFWTVIPFLVSLATFTTYAMTSDEPLTPDIIFPALSLFSLLQFPIAMLASIISAVIQASVSAKRISDFLDCPELDLKARKVIFSREDVATDPLAARDEHADSTGDSPRVGDEIVSIKNGEFKWSRNQPVPTLQDINLSVKKGELLAVLGKVGDGKSSLLASILGELYRSDGDVLVKGRIAYFSQGGWAMGTTIRENITFGLRYEPEFYQKVLDACALGPDLEIFPNGDQTEVGERGISMSGGQRARVALARAVYARADIYLLDDPLAAVDAHVGAHIFKHVIGPEGLLKNKARILTLNSVAVLPLCDQIISVRRGIIIDERGSYQEVMAKRGDLFTLITGLGKQSDKSPNEEDDSSQTPPEAEVVDYDLDMARHGQGGEESIQETKLHRRLSTASNRPKALTRRQVKKETLRQLRETTQPQETRATGAVSGAVYKNYLTSASLIGVCIYLTAHLLAQVTQVSRDIVLKQWGAANTVREDTNATARHYLTIYAIVGFTASIVLCISPLILSVWLVISSSKHFHDGMFNSVLRSPLQYFETIPTGRLLNLFSRDVNVIDETLPRTLHSALRTATIVIGVLTVVSYSVPPFIVLIIPLAIGYYYILRYYLATSRELKRLDATTKSPIFQYFSETLGGLSVIRAFGQQSRFIATSEARVDRNQQCYLPSVTANRWLAVRIELVGALIIFLASTLAVFLKTRNGNMDAGLLGLMMSQTLSTTQALNWVVRSCSEVEQNIVSVERVISYSDLKPEAAYEKEETKPSSSWPDKGVIEFKNYSTRYRPELGLVLKNLNMRIESGERIGVVGRTGAGKSSLTLALFRIIEAAEGSIVIDGVNTSTIGLKDLRTALAIIPQDPQLWEGTLRDNLDPTGSSDDAALWKALDSAHLREHVNSLEGRLDAMLTEGGTNFSSGQRQLLCIARSFLRKSKILVLDEATSAIDLETDSKLQNIVRSQFKGTTITVAHRLDTILDSSRVLVLQNGEMAEFDTPEKLLADTSSIFYSMASEAGLIKKKE